jgi:hypothetical protein
MRTVSGVESRRMDAVVVEMFPTGSVEVSVAV